MKLKQRTKRIMEWVGGSIVVPVVIVSLTDFINEKKPFETVIRSICWAADALYGFGMYEVLIWQVLAGIMSISLLTWIIMRLHKNKYDPNPAFLEYTEDKMHGYSWRWEWRKQGNDYAIIDLKMICPIHGIPLVHGFPYWECPHENCHHGYLYSPVDESLEDKVKFLIHDNAKANRFPKSPP
ncbi:hypothetical protein Barb4_03291 [Bacteroidales bacterium Barb4]|nr:hypothetical protein Barb4_03291 [Bacteroidales bacterium Barb4]